MAGALAAIRGGFFSVRHPTVDPILDLDDSRAVVTALVASENADAIVALARTDNVRQRDGVATALALAPPEAGAFVDRVVGALLQVK